MVRPKHFHRRRRRAAQGFTILELLIVVTIIAVTAALAAPAMHGAIMERKGAEASLDLVRLGRQARSSALAYGRAHVIRYEAAEGGRFRVYRGIATSCNAASNDWATFIRDDCGRAGTFCVDWLDLSESKWKLGSSVIQAVSTDGDALVDICYEPRGAVLHRTSSTARFSSLNTVSGGYIFQFQRLDGGTVTGVSRQVLVPLGGDPRLLQ